MAQDDWQQYLDELFLLARRLDDRSYQLTELAHQQQVAGEQLKQSYDVHQAWSTQKLSDLSSSVEAAKQYAMRAHQYMMRAAWVFVVAIFLGALMVWGGLWWMGHVRHELADTQTQLVNLHFKLQHTPTYTTVTKDGDYIRIVPDKVGSLTQNDQDLSGTYAKIWYPS